jgi:23S rRNA pseudouridine955/2504/2580 synthase
MPVASDSERRPARQLVIGPDSEGQRIDNFLLTRLKGIPRSLVYRILRTGQVRVNSGRIDQAYRVRPGDVVRIPPLRVSDTAGSPASPPRGELQRIEAAILYEDRSILALAKPPGLAVHGGSGLSYGVIEALRTLRPDAPFLELVHRLDRDTSGCLLIAKRRPALRRLHELLRTGAVEKTYLALVRGDWARTETVKAPLSKQVLQSGERMVRAAQEGKAARTRFRPLSRSALASLVEASPATGRTHQIRVHAAHAGHPIAGDPKYGDPQLNRTLRGLGLRRLFLHAHRLQFAHPDDGRPLALVAPLTPDLLGVLHRLGLEVPGDDVPTPRL